VFAPPLPPVGVEHNPLDPVSALLYAAIVGMVVYLVQLRSWWAVCAIVASTPFAAYRDVGPTLLTLPKAILLASAFGLLVSRGDDTRWNRPSILLLAGALAIAGGDAVSIVQARVPEAAVRETLKMLQYALTFTVVAIAMRRRPFELPVRITIALTSALVSLLAIGELFTGVHSSLLLAGQVFPRIAGPLEGPNQLSGYLGLMIPLQLAFVLLRRSTIAERIALVAAIAALVLSFSRSGLLACLVAAAVLVAIAPAARRRLALVTLTAGLGIGILLTGFMSAALARDIALFGRYAELSEAEHPGGVGLRSQLWAAAMQIWREHPLLGIGAGNFELALPQAGVEGVRTHANSIYLQSLAEGGLPLFAAWMYTVSAAIWSFARGPLREPFVAGALAATIGFALHQTVDDLVFYPKVGILFWSVLALGATRYDYPQYD
jgi:O-antigen ligase